MIFKTPWGGAEGNYSLVSYILKGPEKEGEREIERGQKEREERKSQHGEALLQRRFYFLQFPKFLENQINTSLLYLTLFCKSF